MTRARLPSADERVGAATYANLQRVLRSHTGTVLERGKEYVVEARLYAVARAEGFASVESLLEALPTEEPAGALHRSVVEAMLNGETSFFRDHHPFELIRETLLPDLIRKRSASRTLNLWSAAVASGQEAYSLAMLLLESAPELSRWTVRLFATDISESMLTRARSGRFRQLEVNRGLPAPYLVRYFERDGSEWVLQERVRRMVEFSQMNLAAPWPSLPAFDLVLLRNALIYFSSEVRATILQNMTRCIRPDGFLIVGGGETSLVLDKAYEAVRAGASVYYRKRDACGSTDAREPAR